MPEWTKEQLSVIETRQADLLVTAAAGSGKTAVLVERIIRLLTEPGSTIDIDRLLVVTFTDAAAAEMRDKILRALEAAHAAAPEDAHITRQLLLIHHAPISTLHSFCLSVIRDHFHSIDLDPAFTPLEEGEKEILIQEVMEELLEDCYEGKTEGFLSKDADFSAFADAVEIGRKDTRIEEAIRTLYDNVMSMTDPEGFLRAQKAGGDRADYWISEAYAVMKQEIEEAAVLIKEAADLSETIEQEKLTDFLTKEEKSIRPLLEADGFSELLSALRLWSVGRFPSCKRTEDTGDLIDEIKETRDASKEIVADLKSRFGYAPEEDLKRDLFLAAKEIDVLVDLTLEFWRRFSLKKREKNRIDFSDMEHLALQILTVPGSNPPVPSRAALGLREEYTEVMVDEYQDSSFIQEAILTMVSGGQIHPHNRFLVGDVKQSIYGFRQSRPELFMEKFYSYSCEAGKETRRIDLHKNFRSRGEVLDAVNAVFSVLMRKELGGISYDADQALICGASYPEKESVRTDCYLLRSDKEQQAQDGETKQEAEARFLAQLIQKTVAGTTVTDKETGKLRPARYGDVAVLCRSGSSWFDPIVHALTACGISAYANTRTGYFDTEEIQTLLNYLRLLDNPLQDIPMAGVLHSSIGGFSSEELARIRAAHPDVLFCEAVLAHREMKDALGEKTDAFLRDLEKRRERMAYTPIHRLIREILTETGYDLCLAALPNGKTQIGNVEYLIKQAMNFETTSLSGIFRFLRYLDQIRAREVDFGEVSPLDDAEDTVRIMTMHKSKGLEFPIVILAGLGSVLGGRDSTVVSIDADEGIAMEAVDPILRSKNPTIAGQLLKRKKNREERAEELRVLYVAMTRAKERLILLGSVDDPSEEVEKAKKPIEPRVMSRFIMKAKSALDLLLPAIAAHEELFCIHRVEDNGASEKEAGVTPAAEAFVEEMRRAEQAGPFRPELSKALNEAVNWRYPYEEETDRPFKLSVSEIKKQASVRRAQEEQDAAELYRDAVPVPLLPQFMEKSVPERTGAFRGTAYHKFLELYDFKTMPDVGEAIGALHRQGFLTDEMEQVIRQGQLVRFLQSDLAKRMKQAHEKDLLRREQLFVLGEALPGEGEEEFCLVQGIIDACFEEDGALVLVDYKTDLVRDPQELIKRYAVQLEYYAKALRRLTKLPVREAYLYSFALGEAIPVVCS